MQKRSMLAVLAIAATTLACSDRSAPVAPASAANASSARATDNLQNGAVYTQTDEVSNRIVAYYRDSDGTLSPAGSFATGGNGSGLGSIFGQGSVVLSGRQGAEVSKAANHLLFTVNAGSNEISVFRVERNELVLVDKVPSGGDRPISVGVYQDVLYVLHQTSANITGFRVTAQGTLSPIAGSARPVAGGPGSNPAEVAFSPDGSTIVVTERETGIIDTYRFDKNTGLAEGPFVNVASGAEPFGFDFDNRNHLFVTDGFGLVPAQGGASSYDVLRTSTLQPISGDVKNGGTDTCWLIITSDGRFAYVQSFGDSRISSYRIKPDGGLTLFQSVAALTGVGPGGFDVALSLGSNYFYALNGQGNISAFAVEPDGTLTALGSVGGLPPSVNGLAAR